MEFRPDQDAFLAALGGLARQGIVPGMDVLVGGAAANQAIMDWLTEHFI